MGTTTDVTPPCPKSPPKYPDLCGRRRLQLEVQILNRELGFLQDELQSLEGIQPVSRCCKELNEFVGTKPDPIIPVNKKRHGSCCMWRWIRSKICCCVSWICCMEKPTSCCCPQSKNCECCSCESTCGSCRFPKCTCCNSCSDVCHVLSCCRCSNCCRSNCFNSCGKCKPRCCTDCGSCCSESCCSCMKCSCTQPQCFSGGFSCFQQWSCCCKLNCCKSICCRSCGVLRAPSCPGCSCGCVLTCPTCGDICRCIKRNNPCCISGCFC